MSHYSLGHRLFVCEHTVVLCAVCGVRVGIVERT